MKKIDEKKEDKKEPEEKSKNEDSKKEVKEKKVEKDKKEEKKKDEPKLADLNALESFWQDTGKNTNKKPQVITYAKPTIPSGKKLNN